MTAIDDFAKRQYELAGVRALLSDRARFMHLLQSKGREIDGMKLWVELSVSLHRAFLHVIHLMQFDTQQRIEMNVQDGFQLMSGSPTYSRAYVGSPDGAPTSAGI